MVVPVGLKATLAAATAVELFAGTSLTLTPRRFIQRTYGVRSAVDPLTLKFARTAGLAVGCLGVLSGACLVQDQVPDAVLLTLTLYNVAATANNASLQGLGVPTLVHAGLSIALLGAVFARTTRK